MSAKEQLAEEKLRVSIIKSIGISIKNHRKEIEEARHEFNERMAAMERELSKTECSISDVLARIGYFLET